ncbi:Unknown protein sequence [Pseudomonas amygdali pv. lachrymans]|nr:Unknown protein sequence [Pseudomonas amygdali pv. lachrymans]
MSAFQNRVQLKSQIGQCTEGIYEVRVVNFRNDQGMTWS